MRFIKAGRTPGEDEWEKEYILQYGQRMQSGCL